MQKNISTRFLILVLRKTKVLCGTNHGSTVCTGAVGAYGTVSGTQPSG